MKLLLEQPSSDGYCHPVTSAGSGNFGADSNDGLAVEDGPGQILVLGECLVDLAPAAAASPERPRLAPPASPLPRRAPRARPGLEQRAQPQRRSRVCGVHPRSTWSPCLAGPANVAVGLARLGVPSAFAGRFSGRGFGPWLRDNLAGNGIDLRFSVDADEDATIALVTLDSDGRASYTFYGRTTADWQWTEDQLPDLGAPRQRGYGPTVSAVHTGQSSSFWNPGPALLRLG